MIDQADIPKTIHDLEEEVAALKTAQPFYDGQLDLKLIPLSDNAYDYTVVPTSNSYPVNYVIFNKPAKQTYALMQTYIQIFDASMNETYADVAGPEVRHLQYSDYSDGVPQRILFTFYNISGQTRYLKIWTLSTDNIVSTLDSLVV